MNKHNNSESDILRPITDDEFLLLMKMYEKHFPKSIFHHHALFNQVFITEKLKKMNIISDALHKTFYTHRNGNLLSNGTFVSISGSGDYFVSCFTLEDDLSELKECLTKTDLINWQLNPLMCSIFIDHVPLIKEVALQHNAELENEVPSACYLLPKEKALTIEYNVPFGYKLGHIKAQHAEQINSVWPHRADGSIKFVIGLIELNTGLGLFKETGELASWVLQNEYSGLGLLQTEEKEQGKGLATTLIKAMSKLIATEKNIDVIAFALNNNHKSQGLLYKVGFVRAEYTTWLKYKKE